jgi:hypothetical protein
MTEHIVKSAISYVVDFVPYRHRLPRKQAARSDGHVMIREVLRKLHRFHTASSDAMTGFRPR